TRGAAGDSERGADQSIAHQVHHPSIIRLSLRVSTDVAPQPEAAITTHVKNTAYVSSMTAPSQRRMTRSARRATLITSVRKPMVEISTTCSPRVPAMGNTRLVAPKMNNKLKIF